MSTLLNVQHVSKSFGQHHVLKDVNMAVEEGSILGFIGKNGAGKTTLMKSIVGLLPIDHGKIDVCQQTVTFGQNKTNQLIGYLPDVPAFYTYMTAYQYLVFCAEITHLPLQLKKPRIEELLELVGLHQTKQKIAGYSRGMKQRLGIAQALLNKPKLLICDEPTSALDPIGRKEILTILHQAKEQTTILFSTHNLSDIETICDDIVLLNDGVTISGAKLKQLKAQYQRDKLQVELIHAKDIPRFEPLLSEYPYHVIAPQTLLFQTKNLRALEHALLTFLLNKQIGFKQISVLEPTLEMLFEEMVK